MSNAPPPAAVEPADATLPDEAVLELHRSGLMAVIHAHRVSMGHVQTLAARLSA